MSQRVYRFATFTVDTGAHVLLKDKARLSIQEQPFQVLLALLEDAGQVVTREALRIRLWGTDTFVDFDQSLNSAVRRLRLALDDNSRDPVFVETIPRVGFRFLPAVDVEQHPPAPVSAVPVQIIAADESRRALAAEISQASAKAVSRRFPPALTGVGTITFLLGVLLGIAPHLRQTGLRKASVAMGSPSAAESARGEFSATKLTMVAAANETGSDGSVASASAEMRELQGWYHLRQRTQADYVEAQQAFEATLQHEPEDGSALVGLGETEILMALNGDSAEERLRRARSLGQQALAVSPHLGSAHAVIGAADALAHWNDAEAEQEFRTALHMEPRDSLTHLWFAVFVLLPRQDYREAETEAMTAVRQDPLSLIAHTDLGWILYSEGKREAALEQYRFVLQLNPNFVPAQFRVGQVLRAEGHRIDSGPLPLQTIRAARVANATASKITRLPTDPSDVCAQASGNLADAGQGGMPLLQAAVERHCPTAYFFGQDPELSRLRKDPAFVALLQVAHPGRGTR